MMARTVAACVIAGGIAACGRPPSVAEGRALYRANGCANCHGPSGHGDGPIGLTLRPPPRDFRDGAAFKQGHSESAIATTLAHGVRGGAMPAFSHLSTHERRSLAAFVRSLRTTSTEGLRTP
jgi:high-affinity iron transporter